MATHKAFIDLVNSLAMNSMSADELTQRYGGTSGTSHILDGFEEAFGSNWLGNLFAKYSGSRLTDAERQANAFTAYREDLAFQRELAASSTAHQREVADLQAAGINPMMTASGGSGAIVPSMSTAGSVAPGSASLNLGGLLTGVLDLVLRAKKLPAEVKNLESETNKNNADAENTRSRTEGQNLSNTLFRDTMEIKKVLLGDEHDSYEWRRDVAQRQVAAQEKGVENQSEANQIMQQQADAYTKQVDAMYDLMKEQSTTEAVKRVELRALAKEAEANASYRAAMQALDENIKKSQDSLLQEDLKIAAAEARFKSGVYTEDYIKAIGEAAHAEADMKQCLAEYNRGDYHSASKTMQKMFREMEKQGTRGTWSVGSPYFSMSETAPSGIGQR